MEIEPNKEHILLLSLLFISHRHQVQMIFVQNLIACGCRWYRLQNIHTEVFCDLSSE